MSEDRKASEWGDTEAFFAHYKPVAGVVEQYAVKCVRFMRNKAWRIIDVEDLINDTIAEGLRSFHRFQRGTNFKGWIITILRRVWQRHASKVDCLSKRLPRIHSGEAAEDANSNSLSFGTNRLDAIVGRGDIFAGDDVETDANQYSDEVLRAMMNIKARYRTVIMLTMQGCSIKEIAATYGIPEGTVMSLIARGRDSLRRILYDYVKQNRVFVGRKR